MFDFYLLRTLLCTQGPYYIVFIVVKKSYEKEKLWKRKVMEKKAVTEVRD